MSALVIFCVFPLFNLIHHTGPVINGPGTYNKPEGADLLKFINNVQYPPESLNWNDSQPPCSWRGVTCDPDGITVIYLRLSRMNLSGSIAPDSIGMLTSLRVLSLRNNNLSGPIPSDFSRLTYLTTLYLSNNHFSGDIPSAFATLPYLTRLLLNNNNFSGYLPDMNAQDLATFNVSHNKLFGRIPPSLSKFPKSAFTNNLFFCGPPFSDLCNVSYPPYTSNVQQDNTSTGRRAIFGIYSGSTMVLLILLSSVGKKMYQRIKPPSKLMETKKLVMFDEDSFDLEDLLKTTTAEVLGEGSLGTSYKQVFVGKNKTVVVKILKDVVVTEEEYKRKMEVLGKIKNKYVVPLIAFCNFSSDEKLLVYDYMAGGSLFDRLHGSARTQLDWDHRMHIALSVAKGLTYLHEVEEIVHGNIRSSNVYLQQETNNEVSLSDYGLNTVFRGASSLNPQITGYWAPEVLETRDFTFKSDVYSYGVLLSELLTGKIPEHASTDKEGVNFCEEPKVELFDAELVRDHNIDKFLRIAKDCVLTAPDQRPLIRDVVSMMEDMMSRKSLDYNRKGYNDRPLMETRDTPTPIALNTP